MKNMLAKRVWAMALAAVLTAAMVLPVSAVLGQSKTLQVTAGIGLTIVKTIMENHNNTTPTCGCGRRGCGNDGCNIGTEYVDHMTPAMAYFPWQKWEDIMKMEEALCHGTIFAQLDKPYIGRKVK